MTPVFTRQLEKRAKVMADRLNSIEGIQCATPTGAFYCFPDVSAHFGRSINGAWISNSMESALALLEQANVAMVPGVAFGQRQLRAFELCLFARADQ
jgi:aspartate aminotransferase